MRRAVKRVGLSLLALLVICAIAAGGGALWVEREFERAGPLTAEKTIVIPKGTGLDRIAAKLRDDGIIASDLVFRVGVRATGTARDLRAGEFRFPAGVSAKGAADILISGDTVKRRLTIPEGLTTTEAVALIAAADGLVGEAPEIADEGTLLPETYFYSFGDTRADFVRRAQDAMQKTLDRVWAARPEGSPLDSPHDALVLASIIEKETAVPDERATVSSVFHNRLRRGMRLQSDPTVVYGLTGGKGPLGRPLLRRDLDHKSPYNTYVIGGLPPGPIALPGPAALEAAVQPADTKFYYFVADGTGGHVFARTLREHNRNVVKWRRIQRERSRSNSR